MASQSTSQQLTQYGATVVGGVAIASAVGGIAKGIAALPTRAPVYDATSNGLSLVSPGQVGGTGAAVDAATSSFTSTMSSTFTNPAFLTSVGLGVAGILMGSGSKRPSLALPNIMATAGVALSVGALLKQGKASLTAMEQNALAKSGGGAVVAGGTTQLGAVRDPSAVIDSERKLGQLLQLSFPADLGDRYFLKLSIQPYQRVRADQSKAPGNPHTTIRLPLPTNLVDAIKLAYNDLSLGMFGGPMLDAINAGYQKFNSGKGSAASRLGQGARATVTSMKDMLKDENVLYAVGRRLLTNSTIGQAIDIVAGNTPNPHMAVAFQGVNLKKHTYTWRLSPTSEDESRALRQIIRQLQAASLPGVSGGAGLLLTFPDTVNVEIDPPELMMYRPCVIDSVVANYTPNGMPSFFRKGDKSEGHPVEVELAITLREVDIHTNNMEFYMQARLGQQSVPQSPPTQTTSMQTVVPTGNNPVA